VARSRRVGPRSEAIGDQLRRLEGLGGRPCGRHRRPISPRRSRSWSLSVRVQIDIQSLRD
jgi:hypothetical protein